MSNFIQGYIAWMVEGLHSFLRTVVFLLTLGVGIIGGAVFHEPVLKGVYSITPMVEQYMPAKVSLKDFEPPPQSHYLTVDYDRQDRSFPLVI